jgi:hypothetical protein
MDIDLDRMEHVGLDLAVGDQFSLDIEAADFSFSTAGFPLQDDPADFLTDIDTEFNDVAGTNLVEFTVLEIDDLYYRIEGKRWDGETNTLVPFPENANANDVWMAGFGRYGLGMPLPSSIVGGFGHEAIRANAIPGPIITKDWKIYSAWDKTLGFVFTEGFDIFAEALSTVVFTDEGEFIDFRSSLTDDPIIVSSWAGTATTAGGYETKVSLNWDIGTLQNETWSDPYNYTGWRWNGTHNEWVVDEGVNEGWEYRNINTTGLLELIVSYDNKGVFNSLSLTGSIKVDFLTHRVENNGPLEINGPLGVELTEINVQIKSTFTPFVESTTTTTSETTTSESEEDTGGDAGVDLPGFELYIGLTALFGLIFIRRKKY